MQQHYKTWRLRVSELIRELGPLAAVAFVLPGGTLIALGLWAARHYNPMRGAGGRLLTLMAALLITCVSPQRAIADSAIQSDRPPGEEQPACSAISAVEARRVADLSYAKGEYHRAADCYLSAGEYSLADAAYIKSVGPAGNDTLHSLAQDRNDAQAQFRKMKAVWQRHP